MFYVTPEDLTPEQFGCFSFYFHGRTLSLNRMEEIFDVVDDRDQVIGQETRKRVHLQHLKHRAVHILLFNQQGDVFLQKRSELKDQYPNCWDSSCSGHVDSGETYFEAANRELGEELGLLDFGRNLKFLLKVAARKETGQEFVSLYIGTNEGPFELNFKEISEGRFFSRESLEKMLRENPLVFAPAFRFLWPHVLLQFVAE
jgi:isopentenyl-diphosphate Delta-isomerase